LPSGRILDYDGLLPNYPVALTDAQMAAGQDPQLNKALQVVQAEVAGTPLPPQANATGTTPVANTPVSTSTISVSSSSASSSVSGQ